MYSSNKSPRLGVGVTSVLGVALSLVAVVLAGVALFFTSKPLVSYGASVHLPALYSAIVVYAAVMLLLSLIMVGAFLMFANRIPMYTPPMSGTDVIISVVVVLALVVVGVAFELTPMLVMMLKPAPFGFDNVRLCAYVGNGTDPANNNSTSAVADLLSAGNGSDPFPQPNGTSHHHANGTHTPVVPPECGAILVPPLQLPKISPEEADSKNLQLMKECETHFCPEGWAPVAVNAKTVVLVLGVVSTTLSGVTIIMLLLGAERMLRFLVFCPVAETSSNNLFLNGVNWGTQTSYTTIA